MFGLKPADAGTIAGGGIGLQGIGLATSAVGGYLGYEAGKGLYQAQSNIAAMQQQLNALNVNQMQLTARRNSMEVLRNEQRARSLALSNSVNQGANFGSGLQGGYGQIAGAGGNNLLGIAQNLSIGKQEATVNSSIIGQQLQASRYQSQMSTAQGISSLGSGVTSLGGSIFGAATNPSGTLFTNPGSSG